MKDFTTGNEARLILRFATPMLLGNLFQQLYNVTDRIIVGQVISEKALAAVGASFPILFALISFSIGIASGGTIVISQYFGAKDYNNVKKAYFTIFKRCGLKVICVHASSGSIGGELSHEFMVLSESGEDTILICKKCRYGANVEKIGNAKKCPKCKGSLEKKNAIEIGHIFNLGTKYSQAMGAKYQDRNGKEKAILMRTA